MALTRKMLKAMGIEDEKIDQIIEAHTETVDALKLERDQYKEDASKLPGVQKQLDDALEAAKNSDDDTWQVKYDALKEDFDKYKNDISAKETKAKKESAYKQLLIEAGISDKRIDSVMRVSKIDDIELDDQGKIKDSKKLSENIKSEWADFIVTQQKQGAGTPNPPGGTTPKTFTVEEIRKMSTDEINANYDAIKASLKSQ